jgi:hypothetical protein
VPEEAADSHIFTILLLFFGSSVILAAVICCVRPPLRLRQRGRPTAVTLASALRRGEGPMPTTTSCVGARDGGGA